MFIRTDKFELAVGAKRWAQVIFVTYLLGLISGIIFVVWLQKQIPNKADANDVFRSGDDVRFTVDN